MKKFMVLYMANAADFERMMKEFHARAAEEGHGGVDQMDGRQSSVPCRWRRASGQDQPSRRQRRFRHQERDRRLFDRASRNAEAATKLFGKDHPHLQIPGGWIEVIEIMHIPGM